MNSHPAAWAQIGELNRKEYHQHYRALLATPEWKRLRRLVMRRDKHICRDCLVREAAEVHHTTYNYGFFAPATTLLALCSHCHDRRHRGWYGTVCQLPVANDNQPELQVSAAAAE
jgi:5-methylcytosine-specific restriction endonuclease McrA